MGTARLTQNAPYFLQVQATMQPEKTPMTASTRLASELGTEMSSNFVTILIQGRGIGGYPPPAAGKA
jgi:hypothetical protein